MGRLRRPDRRRDGACVDERRVPDRRGIPGLARPAQEGAGESDWAATVDKKLGVSNRMNIGSRGRRRSRRPKHKEFSMNPRTVLRLCSPLAILAGGALVSAQVLLPSVPPKQFGGSVTPAFEGWYDNPDGTHSFLIGYYSRNTTAELDIPIGPNNHFEPGNPDQGQPTHFMPSRRFGMFTFTMPKEFTRQQT